MERHTYLRGDGSALTLPTEKTSYLDGYETGINWTGSWTPGGPYVAGAPDAWRVKRVGQWVLAYTEQTELNNRAYLRGWHDARAGRDPHPLQIDHVAVLGYN